MKIQQQQQFLMLEDFGEEEFKAESVFSNLDYEHMKQSKLYQPKKQRHFQGASLLMEDMIAQSPSSPRGGILDQSLASTAHSSVNANGPVSAALAEERDAFAFATPKAKYDCEINSGSTISVKEQFNIGSSLS